jgi:6-phosphogluconolactonase
MYTINPATGGLTAGTAVAAGTKPASVTVDQTGKFAYVANEGSSDISVYTVNPTTGALTASGTAPAGTNPQSIITTGRM